MERSESPAPLQPVVLEGRAPKWDNRAAALRYSEAGPEWRNPRLPVIDAVAPVNEIPRDVARRAAEAGWL